MHKDARAARAAEIETAAYKVLEEKGYAGLSMQAVSRTAKASNETLYRWYGDKLGLFSALITRNSDVVRTALEQAKTDDPLDTLAMVGPNLLAMLLGPRAVALNRAAAADASGMLGAVLAKSGRETVAPWIIDVMAQAVSAGQLHGTPAELADTWFALLIGDLQIRRVTGAIPPLTDQAITDRSARALDNLQRCFPPA